MTERWIASIIVYTSNVVKRSGARPVHGRVIDSQSVKGAEKGACIDPSGYDAGKRSR